MGKAKKSTAAHAPSSASAAAASPSTAPPTPSIDGITETVEALSLTKPERDFHLKISINLPIVRQVPKYTNSKQQAAPNFKKLKVEEEGLVDKAIETLKKHSACILHNALSSAEMDSMLEDYDNLLDTTGQKAIGEKDASKRSGTRFFNCACQLGPGCKFHDWRDGSEKVMEVINRGEEGGEQPPIWRKIIKRLVSFNRQGEASDLEAQQCKRRRRSTLWDEDKPVRVFDLPPREWQ
jgi:hypothetical protein